jgi:Tfp pilus assembly PilM family ATPase
MKRDNQTKKTLERQKPAKKNENDEKANNKFTKDDEKTSKGKKMKSSTVDKGKVTVVGDNLKTNENKGSTSSNNLRVKKSDKDALGIFDHFNAKLKLFQRLNARPGLALDIDNDKIIYIKFKKSNQQIQVEKWGVQIFDPGMDRFKAMQLALTKIKSRIYKRGMKVYAGFFSPDVNIRHITLPKTKKKSDLESAIFFKNQNDLPNFNKESIWNYQILEEFSDEGVKKLNVLVITVSYDVVRMYMEILINVGMRPEKLVPRPIALATAYNAMVPDPDNDLVVVISAFFTQICYFRNGKLQFFRNAALGVSNIQKTMEEKDNGSLSMSDGLKKLTKAQEAAQEKDISTAIKERLFKKVKESRTEENSVIKMFSSEIKRSVDYINNLFPNEKIKRTFVSGVGIQEKEIMEHLQEQFHDSIVFLKPQFSKAETNTDRYGEYFNALGTSLQVGKEFNTIPAQYKSSQVFKNVNILLITFLFLCVAGAFSFSIFQKYDRVKNQNTLVQLGQQYEKLNPIQTKYDNTVLEYNMVQKDENKLLGFMKKTPELLQALRLFSNETPPFIILNEMKFEEYTPPKAAKNNKAQATKSNYKHKITVAGEIKSDFQMGDVILINFMNQLNDLNYFGDIKLTNKRKDMDKGLFEFWLELHL